MPICFLGLGSNVEDRLGYMLRALELLRDFGKLLRCSTIYESKPWRLKEQGDFLNAVLMMETELSPVELLLRIKEIERLAGRKERERWGPREIDIDILLYQDYILRLSFLNIPHPYLTERDFVLVPLLEIAPDLIHPVHKRPLSEYLNRLDVSLRPFACFYCVNEER